MRSLAAIAAGAVVAAGLYQVGTIVVVLATVGRPLGSAGGPPPGASSILTLTWAAVAAALGGWVGARVARRPRSWVVPLLALLLAAAAWLGFFRPASQWPPWYPPALAAIAAVATLAGGRHWPGRAA